MDAFIQWWKNDANFMGWDWAAHLLVLFLVTLLIWGVWRFLLSKITAVSKNTKSHWDKILFACLGTPVSVLIWLWPTTVAIDSFLDVMTEIDPSWLSMTRRFVVLGIFLWFLLRLVNAIESHLISTNKRDQTTVTGLGHVFRLVLAFIGVLTLLQEFGISLTGLLTFGGVGGLVVGLAAKDLLSNFFGGLMIYFDRPFKVGDWINSPDREIQGTVERIGLRMTMIRAFDSRPIYVPNSVFSSVVVENPSRMHHRRIYEIIGLRYKDADKIAAIVANIKTMLENHPDIEPRAGLMVNFEAFAGSSINFFIYTFTKTVNWAKFNDVKQDVLLQIVDIVHAEGADFAFPTRTISFDKDDIPPNALTGAGFPELN